jgi:hypothetical protein
VIEFATQRSQACLDVAKTIPVSQLAKGHGQILIPTREASRPRISAVTSHATAKLTIRQETDQLRENGLALIHSPLSPPTQVGLFVPFTVQIAASLKSL